MMTEVERGNYEGLRAGLPLALQRGQVVQVLACCGLGGLRAFEKLKAAGTLIPLRGLAGAKQARYGKEHVFALCDAALRVHHGEHGGTQGL